MASRRLILAVLQLLESELEDSNEEAKEQLEVAMQTLAEAYGGLDTKRKEKHPHLFGPVSLSDAFQQALAQHLPQKPSEALQAEATRWKEEGNDLLRNGLFEEAVDSYEEALKVDPSNAAVYCNRASAHSKLQEHWLAVDDCHRALQLDPSYGKAYGRMGYAFCALKQFKKAEKCYAKALELDPDNDIYSDNLDTIAKHMQKQASGEASDTDCTRDLIGLLTNPEFIEMASSVLGADGMRVLASATAGHAASGGESATDFLRMSGQRT